jgi:hypothetical protein
MTCHIEQKPSKEASHMKWLREAGSAAIGGTIHAMVEQPLTTPIEASITQSQINGMNFLTNFRALAKNGALYRSLPTALIGAAPKAIVHYSFLTFWINTLTPGGRMDKADVKTAALVGTCTGASEVLISSPINFVKFRMQRPEWGYTGLGDAIKTIYAKEGLKAFWKGTAATFMRNSICMCGMLGGYQLLENKLPQEWGTRRHLLAGMIGGVTGSFMSYPFEMLRAARQHNVPFWHEIASKGPARLLSGYIPGATRLVVTTMIMGMLIPRLKGFSNSLKFEKKIVKKDV